MKKFISALAIAAVCLGSVAGLTAQTKKDGSKDMRYKKNKEHLKKDGTADKRFKHK